ncbi:MAG: hypothetical protein SFW09_23970 [Hyphomicrobiaceae bacterium]|nr:hypothetical protein [Hyphomicrobiaceae bacterium]
MAVPTERRPLLLNTGRIRDQWHTMTRTSGAPRLMAHLPEPFLDIAPPMPPASASRTAVWLMSRVPAVA